MTTHFLRSYSQLLIQTCHRRGAFAMGGMAAQIPIKNDPAANEAAHRQGARRQGARSRRRPRRHLGGASGSGADREGGIRSAHADAEPAASAARGRAGHGRGSAAGARRARSPRPACATTSASALQYIAAWLAGNGCVPIYNLMEDAATAEISRAQIWQWIRQPRGVLADGRSVTAELFRAMLAEELARLEAATRRCRLRAQAISIAPRICWIASRPLPRLRRFLTLAAYERAELNSTPRGFEHGS